jgi:hypothetical protein
MNSTYPDHELRRSPKGEFAHLVIKERITADGGCASVCGKTFRSTTPAPPQMSLCGNCAIAVAEPTRRATYGFRLSAPVDVDWSRARCRHPKTDPDQWFQEADKAVAAHLCNVHCPLVEACREMAERVPMPGAVAGGIYWTTTGKAIPVAPQVCGDCIDAAVSAGRNVCRGCGTDLNKSTSPVCSLACYDVWQKADRKRKAAA